VRERGSPSGAYLGSLAALLAQAADHLRERPGDAPLSSASRALDHAHQQLLTTAQPLARNPWHRDCLERDLPLYTQTAHHARNLVADATRENTLDPRVADHLAGVTEGEREAVTRLARGLQPGESPVDTGRLDDALLASIDEQLADRGEPPNHHQRRLVRHLDGLDETIAGLGTNRTCRDQQARLRWRRLDRGRRGESRSSEFGG
jgi:hypothetical protein